MIRSQAPAAADGAVNADDHYRNLILNNDRMTTCHLRVFDHWLPCVGATLAYELARVAYYDNGRYQMLKRSHAL